jgi:hypothetical protein
VAVAKTRKAKDPFGMSTVQMVPADALPNPTHPMDFNGVLLFGWDGLAWDFLRVISVYKDLNAVAIGTIATVWTPASGKKVRLIGGTISVSAGGSILFEDNAGGTTVFRTPKLSADTPYNFDLGNGKVLSGADRVLKATLSVAGNITGTLWGVEE